MEISIIIPSKDRNEILFESLEKAYNAIKQLNAEIIVINDSKTKSIELLPYWIDKVKVLNNPKSGVASARNFGAKNAKAKLLLFMDDDMWISEDNIHITINLHKQISKRCCINLNWIYPAELKEKIVATQFGRYLIHFGFDSLKGWNRGGSWDDNELFESNGITSQYLSIKSEDFWNTGGYNEDFPHAGFEDHDFGKRLKKNGITTFIYPKSVMFHNEADRMNIESWLARKQRGAETRKVAVRLGYSELNYDYGKFKPVLYKSLFPHQEVLTKILKIIPNTWVFDKVYFRILNLLLGLASFKGYNKS